MLVVNLRKIEKIISLLQLRVKNHTTAGFTDDAKMLEFLIAEIFNVVYGYNLINTNRNAANAASFDLEDSVQNIKVQVTVKFDITKLKKTLEKAVVSKNCKVYLVGLESVSNSEQFNDLVEKYESDKKIIIKKVSGVELYKLIVGISDTQKIEYLLQTLEQHIDVNSLEVINDKDALESVLHIFNRDAIKCHYSCEGCFSNQLSALEEIKQYINRGVIDGTKLSSNKPLSKFNKGYEKKYLTELDDLLQDFIRAVRKGDKNHGQLFYYYQDEYSYMEEAQKKLIDKLNENQFGMSYLLHK